MKSPLKKYVENLEKDKPKPKVIGEYIDPKYGVTVTVYAGPNDKPYSRMPVGGRE